MTEAEPASVIELRRTVGTLCDRILLEQKSTAFKDYQVDVYDGKSPFTAYITLRERRVHINVRQDFPDIVQEMITKHSLQTDPERTIDQIINHLMVHELNHHRYCPNSTYMFEQMLDAIRSVVEKKELRESRIKALTFDIHNMFSDTVINAVASNDPAHQEQARKYRAGQDLSHLQVLYNVARQHKGLFTKRFDKAMMLFARSNMHLCSTDGAMYSEMKNYLPRYFPKERAVVRELVDCFMRDASLTDRVMNYALTETDEARIRHIMCDYNSWYHKAVEYARIIYPYMKMSHDDLGNSYSRGENDESDGSDGGQEQGQGGEGGQEESEDGTGGQEGEAGKGSGDEDQGETRRDKGDGNGTGEEEDAGKDKSSGQRGWGQGCGKGNGVKRKLIGTDFASLDEFYREKAGEIILSADDPAGVDNFEIYRGQREMDTYDSRRIDWPGTIVINRPDGSRTVNLQERRFAIPIDARVNENIGGLPDLCFVFDSSGSMDNDRNNDSSKYHVALLTFYSIIAGLESKGIAPLLKYNGVNFSNHTYASGWRSYLELDNVKRVLLSHQGGGTTINISKLRSIRETRTDRYVMVLLSDLVVDNAPALEEELVLTHTTHVAHELIFCLGGRNIQAERLESKGIQVLYPTLIEDFMNKTIDFADRVYSGGC